MSKNAVEWSGILAMQGLNPDSPISFQWGGTNVPIAFVTRMDHCPLNQFHPLVIPQHWPLHQLNHLTYTYMYMTKVCHAQQKEELIQTLLMENKVSDPHQ